MCNDNNNKYKCYEGIKSLKTLVKKPQVEKKREQFPKLTLKTAIGLKGLVQHLYQPQGLVPAFLL